VNKSKRIKVHKKTKVKKLQDKVNALKAELYRTQYDNRAIIDGLHRRLVVSERMAADARPPIRWDTNPAVDAVAAIRAGKAKRFVVTRYIEDMYGQEYVDHVRECIDHDIAKAIKDVAPVVTQKDRRTGVTRFSVDFYVLFAE
jgi:hypothetical protein